MRDIKGREPENKLDDDFVASLVNWFHHFFSILSFLSRLRQHPTTTTLLIFI
jgi:hypothetical protein